MKSASARSATYAFIDVETTGFDPRVDRVVEVAMLVIREQATLASFTSLIDPERSIPATASAIHHITDADVKTAPTLAAIAPKLRALCSDAIIVAHNARFDMAFLPFFSSHRVICSMRFAMHVIHDAPNFKNQVLRYHLGLTDASIAAFPAHRALGDAVVTSRIFAVCLERYLAANAPDTIDALIATISAPRALPVLRFGRHRGEPIVTLPQDYLSWIVTESTLSQDVRFTARAELERRRRCVA